MPQLNIIVGACDETTEKTICGFFRDINPSRCRKLADNRLQLAMYNEPIHDAVVSEYWELWIMDKHANYIARHKVLHILAYGRLDELLDKAIAIEEALL